MKHVFRILAGLTSIVMLFGCEQARVDAQLEALCKKDGGMKIYETVALPREQFKNGIPAFFSGSFVGGGYRFIKKFEQLKMNYPSLAKTTYTVIREEDNKVLGIFVTYLRMGGDIMPRLGPDSFKECPANVNDNDFLRAVFVPTK